MNQELKRFKMADLDTAEIMNDIERLDISVLAVERSVSQQDSKLAELDNEIHGEEGMCQDIENTKEVVGEVQADLSTVRDKQRTDSDHIRTLTAIVLKQSKQIESMQREIDDIRGRSMRDNILIHNVPERESEDMGLQQVVVQSLREVGIDFEPVRFVRMHRLGTEERNRFSFQDSKPRIIVAKLLNPQDAELLFKSQKPYDKRKKNGAYITPQYTERTRGERAQLNDIANKVKEKSPQAKIKLSHTTLYVNGQTVKPALETPSVSTILGIEEEEREELSKIQYETAEIVESSSVFVARAVEVQSLNDVRNAYKSLLLKPEAMSATHNTCGYRLQGGDCGYADDKDYGMGRKIVQVLGDERYSDKSVAIFITRQYGGVKLGSKRFDIVRDLTKRVMEKVQKNAKTQKTDKGKDSKKSQHHTDKNHAETFIHAASVHQEEQCLQTSIYSTPVQEKKPSLNPDPKMHGHSEIQRNTEPEPGPSHKADEMDTMDDDGMKEALHTSMELQTSEEQRTQESKEVAKHLEGINNDIWDDDETY